MRNTTIDEISKLAHKDDKICIITGDLGFGVLDTFQEQFPTRFFNAGISEQNMMSVAAGLALEGFKPYVYSIGNFDTLRCLEQIRNDVCYNDLNVKIISVGAGFPYGQMGMTHHATEDIAIMRSLPKMNVFSPADSEDARAVVKETYALNTPCYIRLGRGREPNLNKELVPNVEPHFFRKGDDAIILATGSIINECILAADALLSVGISVSVLNIISIKPLHEKILTKILERYPVIVCVEEHDIYGGLGTAISELVVEKQLNKKLLRIGLPDCYTTIVGSQKYLRSAYNMDSKAIINKIRDAL